MSVRRNDRVSLRCEADGDQPLEVSWRAKGTLVDFKYDVRYHLKKSTLNKGVVSELTIVQAALSDRGEYTCFASNAYGHDHAVLQLQVQEPPNSPTNLHFTDVGSRSVTIAWSLDNDAPLSSASKFNYIQPISSYILQFKESEDVWHDHNNRKLLPGDKTTAKVSPLKPATSYHFRVYAENHLGTSAPSDILHVQTDSEVPSGSPIKVTVEPLGPDQLLVTWRPPDRELWNGEILGYTIGYKKVTSSSDSTKQYQYQQNNLYNYTKVSISGGDGGNDFRLVGLDKYTLYLVTVQAFNAKGDGPKSEPIQVHTLEDVPSAPTSCACVALTSRNIQVTWEPPPKEKQHGTIQGYKIFYEPGTSNVGADGNANIFNLDTNSGMHETKITSALSAVLHGLQPYTNYSVQVLAFTRAGEGPPSTITYCTTEEAVPDAPERVKAAVSGESKVIISWQPPRRPNGIVTKYTVYIRILDKGQEVKIIKDTLLAQKLYYEASDLNSRESYEAWVTASTRIGQGESTPVIKLMPSNSVPAAILSFGKLIIIAWRADVKLECLYVGQPTPKAEWKVLDTKRYGHGHGL